MSNNDIYPRSPREKMDGWAHLPRFIDKLRLQAAGKLGEDYLPNIGKGFDALWLEAAGVDYSQFYSLVLNSSSDGEICDWVHSHVHVPESKKQLFFAKLLTYGTFGETRERLIVRKAESGLENRDDIQCMIEYIDADEGRT